MRRFRVIEFANPSFAEYLSRRFPAFPHFGVGHPCGGFAFFFRFALSAVGGFRFPYGPVKKKRKWRPGVGRQRCVAVPRKRHFLYFGACLSASPNGAPKRLAFATHAAVSRFRPFFFLLSGVGGPRYP